LEGEKQGKQSSAYLKNDFVRMKALTSNFNQEGKMKEEGRNCWKILLLLIALSFLLRVLLIFYPEPIYNDGVEYVRHAKEVLVGNWTGGKSTPDSLTAGKSTPAYPVFIALSYLLAKNFERAGILVSVIFGTLLVLPVFYLGKAIFGEKVAVLSGLLTAVHPVFHMNSGSVLTESTYHFFIATSVLFGWHTFWQGKFHHILLFSFFVFLAYMTRPEGIGLLFVFLVWVLFVNPPEAKRVWTKRVGIILLAFSCFLLFSSPYLLQLRKELGGWQISKKATFSIGSISDEENTSFEASVLKERINVAFLLKNPTALLGKIGVGFLESFFKFQQVYNTILFLLAILGWIRIFKLRSSCAFKANFYILSHHLFFFAFVLPFFWVIRRYTSQMISISIPWAALGCLEVVGWLPRWIERERLRKKVSLILLVILLGVIFIQGRVTHTRNIRVIRKEVGLWMKDHLPRGAKMMSRFPQEAFYAELPWVGIPVKSYEEILRKARSKEVRYLILDGNIEEDSPGFFEKIKKEDLILLKEFKDKKGRRMVVFEIVYPEK
jgi:4-amino-4-deoxy-L-arabinose transferase-like glycosyltransferase